MAVNKRLLQGAAAAGGLVPSENFKVVTFTGDDTASKFIEVGFTPDFVWIKPRGATASHALYDSTRGNNKRLSSNSTAAEGTVPNEIVTNGFNIIGTTGYNDSSLGSMVAWCWKANGGTTSSNTDGDITSTVQANQDAGFSIVKYTTTINSRVGHGLSQAPQIVLQKTLSSANSFFFGNNLVSGTSDWEYMEMASTNAQTTNWTYWDGAEAPNATTFKDGWPNNTEMITYCFHSVEGFSKFGSYTGTGGNLIVETGFEPAFLMIKRTDAATYDWYILDNKRNPVDYRNTILRANASDADQTVTNGDIDVKFLSNGFAFDDIPTSSGGFNASGGTYIYMAFAADPDTEAPTLADSFDIKTYNMTGGSDYDLSFAFKPQFVVTKTRDEAAHWSWGDIIRGNNSNLSSNDSNAVSTTNQWRVKDWYAGATSVTIAQHASTNTSNVSYAWKADDNESTINEEGSIDSIVSANANAGFSIVRATIPANNTTGSFGHGLSAAPELIIQKGLDTSDIWLIYHKDVGTNKYLQFSSAAQASYTGIFANVGASTITTLYSGGSTVDTIHYCFHSVAGYSKIGSYSGDGNATGQTVTLNFAPDWIMIKRTDSTGDWRVWDSVRDSSTPNNNILKPNSSEAEAVNDASAKINFLTTGFQPASTHSSVNASGATYIYMAIKMNPTPYPLAGNMSFLVVAGGASGGSQNAGGGGGGGLRTSYGGLSGGGASPESDITLAAGTYTITVGAGGAALTSNGVGNNGVDSSIAASGLTTITSVGGGGGYGFTYSSNNANSGGSGGGAGTTGSNSASGFGSGTANQGFDGGARNATVNTYAGGGGGGASAAGQTSTSQEDGGDGGAGLAVEITGSSVAYAGGGGGGGNTSAGSGGAGGGTAGGVANGAVSDATANTGGGSGGTRNNVTAGSGGSGVVILRLLTSEYSSSTTGSPTVTTDGDYTVLTYTGSGTYVHS